MRVISRRARECGARQSVVIRRRLDEAKRATLAAGSLLVVAPDGADQVDGWGCHAKGDGPRPRSFLPATWQEDRGLCTDRQRVGMDKAL
jgi:hypothetical protein